MKREPRYWDTSCFLAFLQEEEGRADICRRILNQAKDGKILIVTSALTLAECLRLRGAKPLPAAVRDKVTGFFKSDYIHVRNVTRRIAENARDLVWDNGIDPKDAIHVAAALDAKLALMNAYDRPLISKSGLLGTPRLLIEEPMPPAQGEFTLQVTADGPQH